MNLKALTEQRAEKQTEMETLLNTVKTEERAFTEDENELFKKLESEIGLINETISAITKGRELTEEPTPEQKEEEKKEEDEMKENEERALQEEKAFENYIRGVVLEERADVNLTKGDNGAVIPVTIAKKIIKQVYDICPILEKSTKYNIKGKLEIPYYSETADAKVNMAYATEFKSLESNVGKFASIELTGYLAGALAKISKSLVNNSDFNIVNEVINIMSESIALFVENELLNGTDGKVTGLDKGVKLIVTAESANVITADEIIKTKRKVKQKFQKNAVWLMSPETLTSISLLKDANDRYLLQDDITSDFGYTLLGKPVYETDNMKDIGAGNTAIFYGDLSGLATKFTEELEMEVLREKYADQHAIGVVAWMEFDAKVEDAQKISKLVCPGTAE
ncbi:MAG: phage major capsid protein [Bacilli bacterium]|nr:phage major capsid protein [Bacilli bacterium]MBQ2938506.1 phage major capsid protein [Clostridia bacterium]MBQ6687433.1 phage major capsid protein [Bacilli bacterium]